jgi:uncharacterized protein (DUF924 family)/glutathione S-transferase
MIIETTAGCGQTPRVLFLLEELAIPYAVRVYPDGHFFEKYGRPGPRLLEGERALFDGNPILRHLARSRGDGQLLPATLPAQSVVDGWVELSGRLGFTIVQLLREERASAEERRPSHIAEERAKIEAILALVERGLDDSDGDWLAGDFGLADCAFGLLPRLGKMFGLAKWPRLEAYAARLMQRPALARALARHAAASATPVSPEDVLGFWFGTPAASEAELMSKVQRWFMGGPALDAEVKTRFGVTVEAALSGKLDAWSETPRGRLALVLVLDQFTRNLFRGDPRTHAGDPKAQRLALEAFENGDDRGLAHLETMFLSMPFTHSEDLTLSKRGAEIAVRLAATAAPELARVSAMHVEQTHKYVNVITRFGRFPHRNALLGRDSSVEEQAFLVDWAAKAPPKDAPRPAVQAG